MQIREITGNDRQTYMELTGEFYASPAVLRQIPESYRAATFEELLKEDGTACGLLFFKEGAPAGYALFNRAFSQEAGGKVLWIEELYVRPRFRGGGVGSEFFEYLFENLPKDVKRIRLEVEAENEKARALYARLGFEELPYLQMVRDYE